MSRAPLLDIKASYKSH